MELLEFARGEGLRIAVTIFAAGLIWRLVHLLLTMRKTDLSEARLGGEKNKAELARLEAQIGGRIELSVVLVRDTSRDRGLDQLPTMGTQG